MLQATCWPCEIVKNVSLISHFFEELYETTASTLGLQQAKESFRDFNFSLLAYAVRELLCNLGIFPWHLPLSSRAHQVVTTQLKLQV